MGGVRSILQHGAGVPAENPLHADVFEQVLGERGLPGAKPGDVPTGRTHPTRVVPRCGQPPLTVGGAAARQDHKCHEIPGTTGVTDEAGECALRLHRF